MPTELLDAEHDISTRMPGRVYKRAGRDGGLGLDLIADPVTDAKAMTATAIICTSDVDRDGEVIIPGGVGVTDYVKNPIVLWEHGFNYNVPAPVAKCEHPDGSLALSISKDAIEATSYFTNRNRDSEQIFALVDEGIVRATSIHVYPDYTKVRQHGGVVVYPESEICEWSWCMLGVNPEAVRKAIDRNRLAGSQISEGLLKSLKPWLPTRKAVGRGWTPGGESMPKAKSAKGKPGKPEEDKPADDTQEGSAEKETAEQEPADTESQDKPKDAEAGDKPKADDPKLPEAAATEGNNPTIDGEPGETEVEDQVSEAPAGGEEAMKYGAQLIAGAHAAAADTLEQITAGMAPLENPSAKAALQLYVEHQQEGQAILEGAYAECYPGAGGMPSKAKSESADDTADCLREFLANGQRARHQFAGLTGRLKSISGASNITPEQRTLLDDTVRQLAGLIGKAKSAAPAAGVVKSAAATEATAEAAPVAASEHATNELASLRGELSELTGLIKSITPHNGTH